MKMNLRAIYDQCAAAWAQGDIEGCLALMTVDARYGASIGPEPGRTFTGTGALRAGIAAMIAHDDVVSIETASWNESGSTAYVEWRYRLADGSLALGIDRVDFRDGLICRKEAYRKVCDVPAS